MIWGRPRQSGIARQMLLGMLAATIARIEEHGGRRARQTAGRRARRSRTARAAGSVLGQHPPGVFVSACLVLDASTQAGS
jgi:hypothetical protein